jgi:hypothetical protein
LGAGITAARYVGRGTNGKLLQHRQPAGVLGPVFAAFAKRTLSLEAVEMPRGDKSKYTDKQKRMEEHIEEGKEAERRAWSTVNKQTGGGNKRGGSGRGVRDTSAGSMSHAERSRAAKKGWATRRREGRG